MTTESPILRGGLLARYDPVGHVTEYGRNSAGLARNNWEMVACETRPGTWPSRPTRPRNRGRESWNYDLDTILGSSTTMAGSFTAARLDDGTINSHSSTSYSLASKVVARGDGHGRADFSNETGDTANGTSLSGDSYGTFSFDSEATLFEHATINTINDTFTTVGHSLIDSVGIARQRTTTRTTTDVRGDELDADIRSKAIESLYGDVTSTARVNFTLTERGQRLSGSYTNTAGGSSRTALQSHGTMTDKSDPENPQTTPVRDNEVVGYSLTVTDAGDFVFDSLGAELLGQAPHRTASGHITRDESTIGRSTGFAGRVRELEDEAGGEVYVLEWPFGGYHLSKGTHAGTSVENYTYQDENGSATRVGTFDKSSERTQESREALPEIELPGANGSGTTIASSRDSGSRLTTSGAGTFSIGPAGREVNSAGSEDLETFGADKTTRGSFFDDGNGHRSGSTATAASKSLTTASGTNSAVVLGPTVEQGSGKSTLKSVDRAASNGSAFSIAAPTSVVDGDVTTTIGSVTFSSGDHRGQNTSTANGSSRQAGVVVHGELAVNDMLTGSGGSHGAVMTLTRVASPSTVETVVDTARAGGNSTSAGTSTGTIGLGRQEAEYDLEIGANTAGVDFGRSRRVATLATDTLRSLTAVTRSSSADGGYNVDGTMLRKTGEDGQHAGTFTTNGNGETVVTLVHLENSRPTAEDAATYLTIEATLTGSGDLSAEGTFKVVDGKVIVSLDSSGDSESHSDIKTANGWSRYSDVGGVETVEGQANLGHSTSSVSADGTIRSDDKSVQQEWFQQRDGEDTIVDLKTTTATTAAQRDPDGRLYNSTTNSWVVDYQENLVGGYWQQQYTVEETGSSYRHFTGGKPGEEESVAIGREVERTVTTATTYDTPQTIPSGFSAVGNVGPIFEDVTTDHFTDDHTYSASHTLSDDGKRAEKGRLEAQQRQSKSTIRRAFGETKSHSESATTTWDSTDRGLYETSTAEFLVYEEEGSYFDPASGGKRVSNGKSTTSVRAHTDTHAWNELISVSDTHETDYDHLWQHHLQSEGTSYSKVTHVLTESYGPRGSTLELQVSRDAVVMVRRRDRERGDYDHHVDDDNKYDYIESDVYRLESHERDGQRTAFEEWRLEITLETEIPDHITVQHYSPAQVYDYIAPHDPLENEQAPPPAKNASWGTSLPFSAQIVRSQYNKPARDWPAPKSCTTCYESRGWGIPLHCWSGEVG